MPGGLISNCQRALPGVYCHMFTISSTYIIIGSPLHALNAKMGGGEGGECKLLQPVLPNSEGISKQSRLAELQRPINARSFAISSLQYHKGIHFWECYCPVPPHLSEFRCFHGPLYETWAQTPCGYAFSQVLFIPTKS